MRRQQLLATDEIAGRTLRRLSCGNPVGAPVGLRWESRGKLWANRRNLWTTYTDVTTTCSNDTTMPGYLQQPHGWSVMAKVVKGEVSPSSQDLPWNEIGRGEPVQVQ